MGGEEVETGCEGYLFNLFGCEVKERDVMKTQGQGRVKGKSFQYGRFLGPREGIIEDQRQKKREVSGTEF